MQAASDLPSWVQEVSIMAVACLSVIIAVVRYIKTESKKEGPKEIKVADVVAASFVDSKLLRSLIDTLRETSDEFERVSARNVRSSTDLREALIDTTEAIKLQTDTSLNLLRFMKVRGVTDVI